jgi:hypothetical protein
MENEEIINEAGFTSAFSPLEENVVQRDYTKPKVQIEDISPIEEPIIATPSFEELDNNFRNQLGDEDPSGSADPRQVWGSETETGSANPYVENLDKKEQRMASKAMVDAILDAYGGLKKWSNNLIKLNPQKIKKAIESGDIDGNIAIPIGGGQHLPLMQYVEMYNQETADTIGMSEEFKEKVSPVLLRVLMKRGVGMTDEQLLAYYFGMDIITTGAQVFALRNQNAQLIAQLKEMTESNAGMRNASAAQAAAQSAKNSRANDEATQTRQPEPEPEPQPPTPEYIEPEEVIQVKRRTPKEENYTQVEVLDDLQPEPIKARAKKSRIVKSSKIPEFGTDMEVLAQMDKIARQEAKASNTNRGKRKTK